MIHRTRNWAAAVAIIVAISVANPASAGTGREALVGTGCALSNLVYGPGKMTFALIGGFVGGLAYLFSFGDSEASSPIIRCALRGDYAITPEHLRGDRELEFCGRSDEQRAARNRAEASDPGTGDEPGVDEW